MWTGERPTSCKGRPFKKRGNQRRKARRVKTFYKTTNLTNTKIPKLSSILAVRKTMIYKKAHWGRGGIDGGRWQYPFSTSSFYQLSNIHHSTASFKTALYTSLLNRTQKQAHVKRKDLMWVLLSFNAMGTAPGW